jgi:hypothetical protein
VLFFCYFLVCFVSFLCKKLKSIQSQFEELAYYGEENMMKLKKKSGGA